jgi:hypothetical protein
MSDAEKPEDSKPIFTVFPRNATAKEIAEALRALVEKHVEKPAGDQDEDESEAVS